MIREPDRGRDEATQLLERIAASPELYLLGLDFQTGMGCLVPMTEESYRRSSFLDARMTRPTSQEISIDIRQLAHVARRLPRRPLHFIYHIGHCGSTLLTRMLDEVEGYFVLREPPLLKVLANTARSLGHSDDGIRPDDWMEIRNLLLVLLSRTWRAQESAVVKPQSHCNNIMGALLGWAPQSRGILLYIDLESYLATMLRSKPREDTSFFIAPRLQDFRGVTGADSLSEATLSQAEQTTLIWLMQMYEFRRTLSHSERGRQVMPLDFDDLLANPRGGLGKVCDFFGTPLSETGASAALADRILHTYAKSPEIPLNAEWRKEMLDEARRQYAPEIAEGIAWARRMFKHFPKLGDPDTGLVA